jgi:hypothetical protein
VSPEAPQQCGAFFFSMNRRWTAFRKKLRCKIDGASLVPMSRSALLLLLIMTAAAAAAQACDPPAVHPQVDSAFDYVHAEILGLRWMKRGVEMSHSIPTAAAPGDPQRAKQGELRNTMVRTLNNYYDCAAQAVTPYKDSKITAVHDSVESILNGIEAIQQVNRQVLEALAAIDRANNASDVDPSAVKRLAEFSASEDEARAMITLGVRISTFGLTRTKDNKPEGEPVAFTVTEKQHDILVAEAQQFAKEKSHNSSFIDACATILLSSLTKKLPTMKE